MSQSDSPQKPDGDHPEEEHYQRVVQFLRRLAPDELEPAAKTRIWKQVSSGIEEWEGRSAARQLRQLSVAEPSPAAKERIWKRFMDEIEEQPVERPRLPLTIPQLRRVVAVGLVLILLTFGLFSNAANSLPGEVLYPLRRSLEEFRWQLTLSDEARSELAKQLVRDRLEEVEQLVAQRSPESLVRQAVQDGLETLTRASPWLPRAELNRLVLLWQEDVESWPRQYREASLDAINEWFNQERDGGVTPTATASPSSSNWPTAATSTSTAVGTAQATVTPSPSSSPTVISTTPPNKPTRVTPTPTQSPSLPSVTSTPPSVPTSTPTLNSSPIPTETPTPPILPTLSPSATPMLPILPTLLPTETPTLPILPTLLPTETPTLLPSATPTLPPLPTLPLPNLPQP